MATRTRSRVNLKTYPEQLERFLAQYMEAVYRQLAGLDEEMGLPAIYAEHADLFSVATIEALRERAEKDDEGGREARELPALGHLAFAPEFLDPVRGGLFREVFPGSLFVVIFRHSPTPPRRSPR